MASGNGKNTPPAEDPLREDPTVIEDKAEFPEPSLYFKIFESEEDEPEFRVRSDVNKLYERWIEKYGRRWPEDGLNTEDIIWLAEEANAPVKRPRSLVPSKPLEESECINEPLVREPLEESEYTNEFIPLDDDGILPSPSSSASDSAKPGDVAAEAGNAKPSAGRPPLTNYEKTVAGAKWVTDEFESEDYEAGNLEQLWNMYLWDREGNPTMMPTGVANAHEGEESETWSDFYTAYRPRNIDTEEAREAVWATDEFESEEDNTESEWGPEYVGAGLGLKAEDPLNPQYSLRHSNHPLAPFPGEALEWASYVYPDFTTYEGLAKQSIPHGMGVMTFGMGTGAGFQMDVTRYGDRYEGEFQAGFAHGLGKFTSETSGEVFIGEFFAGQRHGCGLRLDMKPFYYLLERGVEPAEAYRRTSEIMTRTMEARTWYRGTKLGDAKEDEVIQINVLRDELDQPFEIALRNTVHDAKLKRWKGLSATDKVLDRLVAIIERNQARNPERFGPSYYKDERGHIQIPSETDTDYSMEMFQGRDTDGDLGFGWNDATDSSENPMDAELQELMVMEGEDDKLENEELKDSVFGESLINPYTGLTLGTYLDGKERQHNELVDMWMRSRKGRVAKRKSRKEGDRDELETSAEDSREGDATTRKERLENNDATRQGSREAKKFMPMEELPAAKPFKEGEVYKPMEFDQASDDLSSSMVQGFLSTEDPWGSDGAEARLVQLYDEAGVSPGQVRRAEALLERWNQLLDEDKDLLGGSLGSIRRAENNPLAPDDTDTGFETDSDMMEMCDLPEIMGTVQEASQIVERARMWRFKPYGEVTIQMAQDANGSPANLMQDALHYPHGTKFMAPGPLGLVHPIPADPALRAEMARVASNYAAVYRMYNFDWDPEPGSIQYKIDQRIRRAQELRNNGLARYIEAADEVLAEEVDEAPQGNGEELLMASTTGATGAVVQHSGGSMFASMSLAGPTLGPVRLSYAARVILGAFANAAKQVPVVGRPRLARPSRGSRRRQ